MNSGVVIHFCLCPWGMLIRISLGETVSFQNQAERFCYAQTPAWKGEEPGPVVLQGPKASGSPGGHVKTLPRVGAPACAYLTSSQGLLVLGRQFENHRSDKSSQGS